MLPYEGATSGEKATQEMQKILRAFGSDRFGVMVDDNAKVLIVQFSYRGRDVLVKASMAGYAAAWLKANPYTRQKRSTQIEWERKALGIAHTAVYSILRDWIKGQITAIETGIVSFEGAFLGQILLQDGRTVLDHATADNLLAAPKKAAP